MPITLNWSTNAPKEDRVRARTAAEVNERIDTEMERRIRFFATQDQQTISERIEELDREWDVERVLEANAASLTLLGAVFSIISGRRWLIVPLVVSGFLLKHAIDGWCPPVPLLRSLGVRTRLEIEQERYALKVLRGDFDHLSREQDGTVRNPLELAQTVRA